MPFDNVCKLLAEKHPDRFATWILGKPQSTVKVLKTELSIEPIRADSVTFLQLQGRILHLECQVRLESDPPLPLRMLDYWVRLHRLYRLPVTQVVVLLLPPASEAEIENIFAVENTRHEYRVIRLWQEDPELFLQDPALLPLAALAKTSQPEVLLQNVAQRVRDLEGRERQEVSGYTQILAGLKYKKVLIRQLFREDMMRESVIYQDILAKGLQEGGRSLILRQLTRRLGEIPGSLSSRLATLSPEQLGSLGEALLEFETLADLEAWFENLE